MNCHNEVVLMILLTIHVLGRNKKQIPNKDLMCVLEPPSRGSSKEYSQFMYGYKYKKKDRKILSEICCT